MEDSSTSCFLGLLAFFLFGGKFYVYAQSFVDLLWCYNNALDFRCFVGKPIFKLY